MNPRLDIPQPIDAKPKMTKLQKVGATLGLLGAGAAVFLTGHANETKPPVLPTVKEFTADPGKYEHYEQIVVQPGDTPQGIAAQRLPGIGVELGGDAIIREDKQNAKDNIGHNGLEFGEPLIVPKLPEQPEGK